MDPGIPGAPGTSTAAGTTSAPTDFEYMTGELTKQVCCIKYSLMACNAFGIMLGIFVVLFGISYPEENFPGGYKGKETAGISGFFIIFTLIGYYGAHRQKIYFLVPYSVIIFLFLGGNLMMWGIKPEESVLKADTNAFLIVTGVFGSLMVFALWLAWQERKKKGMANVSVTSMTGMNSSTSYPMMMTTSMTNAVPAPVVTQQPQPQMQQQSYQPPLLSQQQSLQQRQPQQSVTFGPYGPRPGLPLSWDIDSKVTTPYLNVFYQPESNSYVTLPVRGGYDGRMTRDTRNMGGTGGFLGGGPLLMW